MSKLKIALQKSGRLSQKSLELLKKCGIKFESGNGKLITEAKNFPLEILYLRDDDIPQYVEQGVADLGILGENEVNEKARDVEQIELLGFAACRLSLAIPKDSEYAGLDFFQQKRVATSYPNILQNYFQKEGIQVSVEEISGSVEVAPSIGLADAVCDIVSTGSTLISNGLKEVEQVMTSQAVLIGNKELTVEKARFLDRLLFRIKAVKNAETNKYIMLNAPNDVIDKITDILPGMKSPTVIPLSNGWSSMQSVVREDDFWEVIDQLQDLGAQGILVVPIEKMIV